MGRSHLKGAISDELHLVLCAVGYNVRWLLRMIAKKGLRSILRALRATAATTVRGEQRRLLSLTIAHLGLGHRREPPSCVFQRSWTPVSV